MAAVALAMPKLGMTMEEGTVVQWPLALGAPVAKGETVLVIESEKNESEIEAPAAGVLRHIYVPEGETVPCGALLAAITAEADEAFDAEEFFAAHNRPAAGPKLQVAKKAATDSAGASTAASAAAPAAGRGKISAAPAARALAKKLGIALETISGGGPGGRITKEDVQARAKAREALTPVAPGVALEVLREGPAEGEAVLLLPGLGVDAAAFAQQIPALAAQYRVLALNPRGVGNSDSPAPADENAGLSPAQTAADAAAVIEASGGAAHIVGASLGAAAALELALSAPRRCKTLTLITPFTAASPRLLALAEGWQRAAAEAAPETLAALLLPWFFSPQYLADENARARTLRGLAQSCARVPAQTLRRMARGMAAWSGTRAAALQKIRAATLVVSAGQDLLTPPADAAAVAAAIPGAHHHSAAHAGHAVAQEAAAEVTAAIQTHLAGAS